MQGVPRKYLLFLRRVFRGVGMARGPSRKSAQPAVEITSLDDKKIAIEFPDRHNRIRGTAILLFLKEGYAKSLGHGQYLISEYLGDYLKRKGIEFRTIPLPPK